MLGSRGIPAQYSGIEASLQEICPRLVKRGHRVSVYCAARTAPVAQASPPASSPVPVTYKGVLLRRLPAIYTKHLETATRTLLSALSEMASDNDIVHFHALGPSFLSFIPRFAGKSTVATVHGLDWQRAKWGTAARTVLKLGEWGAAHFPDATVVVSQSLKEYFYQKYDKEVFCIPNGVNIPKPKGRELLARLGLQSSPYILYVSRLIRGKGLGCLLRAFNSMKTEHKLVLAGDAGYDHHYEKQLRRLAGDSVIFAGFVTGRLLEELYSNAEFYVHPAPMEGLSISLLEAMSYGRCVLASDIPPNREVLSDKGFYFAPGDVEELKRSMTRLLSGAELRQHKGQEAREHVSKCYNWDRIVDKIEQLYIDVLKRRRKCPA
ncbi:MAG: glycosyltransferase family 4 protein [bacterium]|nr:glycosyltransferase family 4 protein [bacterium]